MSSYECIGWPKFCMVFPLKSKGMTSRWPLGEMKRPGQQQRKEIGSYPVAPAIATSWSPCSTGGPTPR